MYVHIPQTRNQILARAVHDAGILGQAHALRFPDLGNAVASNDNRHVRFGWLAGGVDHRDANKGQ